MKNIRVFLSENFQFLEIKFSIYLNRRVFVIIHNVKSGPNFFSFLFCTESTFSCITTDQGTADTRYLQ